MAVLDVRAEITCSLGELISASLNDTYAEESGLIQTTGECVIKGIIRPEESTNVFFYYALNGQGQVTLPRYLKVKSYFADPFRNTTTVQLADIFGLSANYKAAIDYTQYDDPNTDTQDLPDPKIVVLPVYASSVASECAQKIGVTGSFGFLTNRFSVEKFDLSPGYVQVLSDLLVSECYIGYLTSHTNLTCERIQSINGLSGGMSVVGPEDIIDISAGGSSDELSGDAVVVTYDTVALKKDGVKSETKTVQETVADNPKPDGYDEVLLEKTTEVDFLWSAMSGAPINWIYEDEDTGEIELVNLISGTTVVEDTEVTTETGSHTVELEANLGGFTSPLTKTITRKKGLYLNSPYGSQYLSWIANKSSTKPTKVLDLATGTCDFGSETRIVSGREAVAQFKGSSSSSALDSATKDDTGSSGGPDNGYSIESRSRIELTSGAATSENVKEFSMPYAPDDIFSEIDCAQCPACTSGSQEAVTWDYEETIGFPSYYFITYQPEDADEEDEWNSVWVDIPKTVTVSKYDSWDRLTERVTTEYYIGAATIGAYIAATVEYDFKNVEFGCIGCYAVMLGGEKLYRTTTETVTYKKAAPSMDVLLASGTAAEFTANDKCYTSVKSDADTKARNYGLTQNDLLIGARYAMNIQTSIDKLPLEPLAPFALTIGGTSATYRVNGLTFTLDANGLIIGCDALFSGGIGGELGDAWFPVSNSITSLPQTPAVENNQITITSTVPLYNLTIELSYRVRTLATVESLPYSLDLPLKQIDATVKVKLFFAVVLVSAPCANLSVASPIPSIELLAPYYYPYVSNSIRYTGVGATGYGWTTGSNFTFSDPLAFKWKPGIIFAGATQYSAYWEGSNWWFDSRMGTGKFMATANGYGWDYWDYNASEIAERQATIISFDSNGFTLGKNSQTNELGEEFAAWALKEGAAPVTNTSGSITSQVSITKSGTRDIFSTTTYVGNGINNATVGHGLSQTPSIVIVKGMDDFTPNRTYYFYGAAMVTGPVIGNPRTIVTMGYQDGEPFQDSGGFGYYWGLGGVTSSIVTLGSNSYTNGTYCNFLMYSFLDVPGVLKVGTYVGNNAPSQIIDCGLRPNMVIAFPLTIGPLTDYCWWWSWVIQDKNTPAGAGITDFAYPSYSSYVDFPILDLGVNGFTVTTDQVSQDCNYHMNALDVTYVYLAFAERQPMARLTAAELLTITSNAPSIRGGASVELFAPSAILIAIRPGYAGKRVTIVQPFSARLQILAPVPMIKSGAGYTATAVSIGTVGRTIAGSGFVDPYWNKVGLLMRFDGNLTDQKYGRSFFSNGTYSYAAESPLSDGASSLSITTASYPNIYTAIAPSTTLINGVPLNTNVDFESGDFTVELWFKKTSETGHYFDWYGKSYLIKLECRYSNSDPVNPGVDSTPWSIDITNDGGGTFLVFGLNAISPDNNYAWDAYQVATPLNPVLNTWYHVAGVRHGEYLYLYVNGVRVNTTLIGLDKVLPSLTRMSSGQIAFNRNNYRYISLREEARVTGVARYTGPSFTLPTKRSPIALS